MFSFPVIYLPHFSHRSTINSDRGLNQFLSKPVEVFYIGLRLGNCMYQTVIPIPLLIFNYIFFSVSQNIGSYFNFFFPSENHLGRTLHFSIPESSMSNGRKKIENVTEKTPRNDLYIFLFCITIHNVLQTSS